MANKNYSNSAKFSAAQRLTIVILSFLLVFSILAGVIYTITVNSKVDTVGTYVQGDDTIMFLDEQLPAVEPSGLPEVIVERYDMRDYVTQEIEQTEVNVNAFGLSLDGDVQIMPMSSNNTSPEATTSPLGYSANYQAVTTFLSGQRLTNFDHTAQILLNDETGFSVKFPGNQCDWILDENDNPTDSYNYRHYLYYSTDNCSTWQRVQDANASFSPGGNPDVIFDFTNFGEYQLVIVIENWYDSSPTSKTFTRTNVYHIVFDEVVLVPLPEPPLKEGYTFVGWFFDENHIYPCTVSTVTSNTVLYAKYVINTYIVNFETNGGSVINAITLNYGSTINLSSFVTTRVGYDFKGWYTDASFSTSAADSIVVKSDTELFAKFEIKVLSITLVVDGEVWQVLDVNYGTTVTAIIQNISATAYTIKSFVTNGLAYSEVADESVFIADTFMTLETKQLSAFWSNFDWVKIGIWVGVAIVAAVILALIITQNTKQKRKKGG